MAVNKSKNLAGESMLRHQAEKVAEQSPPQKNYHDIKKLVHELEVHQIQLEMQNDELRKVQAELELSANMYAELFEFAPIAYLKFDADGIIRRINHAGAELLGIERGLLAAVPFSRFIASADERECFCKIGRAHV